MRAFVDFQRLIRKAEAGEELEEEGSVLGESWENRYSEELGLSLLLPSLIDCLYDVLNYFTMSLV